MKTNTIPPPPSNLTFALDLGDGTKCTAQIDLEKIAAMPAKQLHRLIGFFWEGTPRNAHFPQYSEWIQSIWQRVADVTERQLMLVLRPPSGDPFAVHFEPNQPSLTIPLPRR